MLYDLVLIGANDGRLIEAGIRKIASNKRALLAEALPHLALKLTDRFADLKNVTICSEGISSETKRIKMYYIPDEKLEGLPFFANQLGSNNPKHILDHFPNATDCVKTEDVNVISVEDFISKYEISEIDQLSIDTEGHDYTILQCFPFWRIKPNKVIFEHRHMDGTNTIGRKYAEIILKFGSLGYRCQVLDTENTLAYRVS